MFGGMQQGMQQQQAMHQMQQMQHMQHQMQHQQQHPQGGAPQMHHGMGLQGMNQGMATQLPQMPQMQPAPAQTAQVCQANCTSCGALLQFNMPSRPSTIQCYNCKALMVVQPQAATNLSMQQQMAQGGAMTPHMEKKQRKKREGPPRQPTAYNNFMKAELAKIKQENSEMHHREAFKIAAARWAESEDNPKNQKGGIAAIAAPKAPEGETEEASSKEEAGDDAPKDKAEEAPATEEAAAEERPAEPTADEPAAEAPAVEEPAIEEPAEEQAAEEPAKEAEPAN
eukprot:TRINITY_DN4930_c0_g1_i1.p1 TRINITY_DN4930_c0_g1~~TRINITY_DN4930_c0_g1_i1.p1  ORF type:complete len:283 (+),score=88.86 TRINITY_DN4930_c0_g1_i1:207-1055(+)